MEVIINAVPNIPLTEDANFIRFAESRQKGEQFFVLELRGERMQEHYQYLKTIPAFKAYFDYAVSVGFDLPETQIHHLANFSQGNLLFITLEPCPEFHDVFKRFAAVFEQTYTRFLDLQKAEAQTREAEINLAVERVRAKALAMHRSDEIMEVVTKLKDEVMGLNIPDVVAATIFLNEGDGRVRMWDLTSIEKKEESYQVPLDITFTLKENDPHLYVKRVWENGENYFVEIQDEKGFIRIMAWLREHGKNQVADEVEAYLEATRIKRLYHAAKKLNNGKLVIDLLDPPSAEIETILTRMGAAFDLAYKRFQDLQRAEAQAREAQIELSLERVRARTMAMHKSEELVDTSVILFQELRVLGVKAIRTGVAIIDDEKELMELWSSQLIEQKQNKVLGIVPMQSHPFFKGLLKAWRKKDHDFSFEFTGEKVKEFYETMSSLISYPAQGSYNPREVFSPFFFPEGSLTIVSHEPLTNEERSIMQRFARVFGLLYRRFLDLQNAEAQAREGQIELALERVRAKTMAMQRSDELADVASTLFQQIRELGGKPWSCGFVLCDENREEDEAWMSSPDGHIMPPIYFPHTIDPVQRKLFEAWKNKIPFTIEEQGGEELKAHYQYAAGLPSVRANIEKAMKAGIPLPPIPVWQRWHAAIFSKGYLLVITHEPYDETEIFKRFANVFEQTYTRFLDLQKAEAQAREAQIETALERVRSRTMAMHKSEELTEVSALLYKELQGLGVTQFLNCGYVEIDEVNQIQNAWMTNADGLGFNVVQLPLTGDIRFWRTLRGMETKRQTDSTGSRWEIY